MRWVGVVTINLVGVMLALGFSEGVARLIEPRALVASASLHIRDQELGWVPRPNSHARIITSEFDVEAVSNNLGLHDFAVPPDPAGQRFSILALGDSHTAATGVPTGKSWPKVLQDDLERNGVLSWVYNAGVHGYSIDQYLVRFRQLAPILKPHVVIVGFSVATDFYDVGLTKWGGFVYGSDIGRVYFSLNTDGDLVEHRELVGQTLDNQDGGAPLISLASLRSKLNQLALYRLFSRSEIAMWLAMRLRTAEESLWPGLDTALRIDMSADDRRRFDLASKLIGRIAYEAHQLGAVPMLVHIPYLAQVYDSVWNNSFGSVSGYNRDLAGKRLDAIAQHYDMVYVDVDSIMRDYVAKQGNEWVHYAIDGHPTVTGQRLIGDAVFDALRNCLKQDLPLRIDRGSCSRP